MGQGSGCNAFVKRCSFVVIGDFRFVGNDPKYGEAVYEAENAFISYKWLASRKQSPASKQKFKEQNLYQPTTAPLSVC